MQGPVSAGHCCGAPHTMGVTRWVGPRPVRTQARLFPYITILATRWSCTGRTGGGVMCVMAWTLLLLPSCCLVVFWTVCVCVCVWVCVCVCVCVCVTLSTSRDGGP